MSLDSELLKKYNVPGPRYTSYPTVPYWEVSPSASQWIESIRQALEESESVGVGAALYIHIPFCESLCTYCGCNTRITRNRSVSAPYVATVLKEWGLYLELLSRKAEPITISELHLGGGTPTFATPEELGRLIDGIRRTSILSNEAELSVEADPRVTHHEHLVALSQAGFTRLSLGIQDFDPKVQETVHRVQSVEQVNRVTEDARALGFSSINYDLIYGLPFQTERSVADTIEKVVELKPDRIAFYAYAHVPWIKPGQRRFTDADLPSGDQKRALYELGRRMLEAAGYREIGMDHFALETDSLWKATQTGSLHRNFMGYTARRVAPLIGLGVSSIGDSWRAFAQNEKLLETYVSKVDQGELPLLRGHLLTREDQVLRQHILNLMTTLQTSWTEPELQTGYLHEVEPRLRELIVDGLVQISRDGCVVNEKGRAFLRNVCMAFDARLSKLAPSTQLFSKTI